MAVSAQHFTEVTNGYEQRTGGLWVHRGEVQIKGPSPAIRPATSSLVQILSDAVPRISPTNHGWQDAHLTLNQSTPSEPRIGFHEAGSTGLTLYKQSGANTVLRVRGNDGVDFPLAGAPNSGQEQLGYWSTPSSWTTPQANVWLETDVRVNFTSTVPRLRAEFMCTTIHPTAGAVLYLGLGYDGNLSHPSVQAANAPTANYLVPMSGTVYFTLTPGAHRISLWLHGTTAGNGFWGSAYANLAIIEQKI